MTMENMGELPADQQINGDSSNGTTTQSQPSPQEPDYVNTQDELETSITRSEAIPVSVSSMIDSSEFRSQMGEVTYHTLNGRMSPSYSPTNNYATLTPLQPLPPISTVSDKFNHVTSANVSGSFALMSQNNGIGNIMDMSAYGHRYHDKLGMGVSMNMGPTLGATAMTMMSSNNLSYQQSLGSYGYAQNGLASPKSEPKMASPNSYVDSYAASPMRVDLNTGRLHSPNSMMVSMNGIHSAPTPSPHSESPQRDRPGTSLDLQKPQQQEIEEINTKELAQRISSELKRYSIPQAVFAQRVLCRSQGTLSDLLRNPKPWSKLKSGRETFRRMWKWLQEPEFQRMSALRLAGAITGVTRANNVYTSSPIAATTKVCHGSTMSCPAASTQTSSQPPSASISTYDEIVDWVSVVSVRTQSFTPHTCTQHTAWRTLPPPDMQILDLSFCIYHQFSCLFLAHIITLVF
uniref:One cut domain family member n=1 Tax=Biomphalaria glabrata TaxID=6526 RepID=A0A2C9K7Y6_BIOGL